MEPPVDRIRLSPLAKEQLVQLKRTTGIEQWNILCRWAFCLSLAELTAPSAVPLSAESGIEMTWRVFSGELSGLFLIALKHRCWREGLATDRQTLAEQLRLHLHRGIGYLAGDHQVDNIEDLINISLSSM
ncbi:DNA sulfur modification protein DndE [Capilliphycus salinus ALCB114379]|uniref:DNA sulfur modification protein DndE n=1 Tax=Capilliphycus salinus TaxID=2768948 RepID=UPI0039A4DF13